MRKPWDLPPGSQGCAGAGRVYAKHRARRMDGGKLLLGCVTLLNVVLSLILAVYNRKETIHAVCTQDGEGVQVLVSAKKQTKTKGLS